MSKQVQFRRGTTTQVNAFTGAEGEVVVDTTKDTLVVQDGTTAGGFPLAKENNPAFTGNMTMSTGGSYIQFSDGSKQYTAAPQLFYMILPGTLYTPLVGSSRYYPITNMTVSTIYYNLSQASTTSVAVDILRNGVVVNSFSIAASAYNGSVSTSIALTVGQYVTLNVNSGNGSDLTFRFAYV